MDIRFYFEPVDFAIFQENNPTNWKHTLGATIEKTTHALTPENMANLKIAIVGVPFDNSVENLWSPEGTQKIREELYQLAKFDLKMAVADFGNLLPSVSIKGNYQSLRDVIDYFAEMQIVTIVIGGSQDLTVPICEPFFSDPFFSLTTIDAFADIKKGKEPLNPENYLSKLFSLHPHIFQFNIIGLQSHYTSPEYLSKLKGINQHIRLGQLRENIAHAEPVFRNSDLVSFDISAVKYSEAPGTNKVIPNGLRSEEACQLARYAGLSTRIKSFGLFGYVPENDEKEVTSKLAAQLLWYFMEGAAHSFYNPGQSEKNKIYQVEVKGLDKPLVFYHDMVNNRWWIQVDYAGRQKMRFACTGNEYEQASNNEIPELWINYICKIDEVENNTSKEPL
jgi:arginase family enzyme